MAFIQIRKKSENAWKHITDVKIQEFMISEFYFKLDNGIFQIVEVGGAQRVAYQLSQITVYDDTSGGTPETFTTDVALYERLLALKYTGFKEGSGGGGGTLTLEEARQNGDLIYGNILGVNKFNKTGLPFAFAQMEDIKNAVGDFIPLSGTEEDKPVNGNIIFEGDANSSIKFKNPLYNPDDPESNEPEFSCQIFEDGGSMVVRNYMSSNYGEITTTLYSEGLRIENPNPDSANIDITSTGITASKYIYPQDENYYVQQKYVDDALTDGYVPLSGTEVDKPITGDLYIEGNIVSQTSTTTSGVTTTKEYDIDSMGTYAREEVVGGGSDIVRQVETDIYNGFGHVIENGSNTKSIIVTAELGVVADHYIDKEDDPFAYAQMQDIENALQTPITLISDTTVALSITTNSKYYGLTSVNTLASLPPISGYENKLLIVANKSGGQVEIYSNDGVSNDIYDNNNSVSSLLLIGGTVGLFNDGVNWVVVYRNGGGGESKVIISDSNVDGLVKTQGVAGTVVLKSYTIPANTIPPDCVLRVALIMTKIGNGEAFTTSFGVGTVPAIPIHSITSSTANNNMVGITRVVRVSNNRIYGINNSGSFYSDYVAKTANLVDASFNTEGVITLNLRVSTVAGLDEVSLQSLIVEVLPQT